jgi:hypothetical protein
MKEGIQTFLAEAGEAGCYALCILEIAQREHGLRSVAAINNVLAALNMAIDRGHIYYNENDPNDNDNFFVKDPAAMLSWFTMRRWTVDKVGPDYQSEPGERIVERWERVKTGTVISHFRLPDWDSLHDSQTVRYGKIVSKRVFRRVS